MSLQGTLDTFDLADVLFLLERGKKTGALDVESDGGRGVLFVIDGRFAGAGGGDADPPASTYTEFEADLVEACAALLRLDSGTFHFDEHREPSQLPRDLAEITPVVEAARRAAEEWRRIEAMIPSLDAPVLLAPELPMESLLVDRALWRLFVNLDGSRSVHDLVRDLGRPLPEVGRLIAELYQQRLVAFYERAADPVLIASETPPAPPPPAPAVWSTEPPSGPAVDAVDPMHLLMSEPPPEPVAEAADPPVPRSAPRSVGELAAWADDAPDPYAAIAGVADPPVGAEARAELGAEGPPAEYSEPVEAVVDDLDPDAEGDDPGEGGADDGADEMRRDRGALLRMFSSLKE